MNKLELLRDKIDSIDKEIIFLLSERTKFQLEIARYKLEHNLPIYQPIREQILIDKVKATAKEAGVSPEFAKELYKLILKESKKIQTEIFSKFGMIERKD